jgi:hypothetical protein
MTPDYGWVLHGWYSDFGKSQFDQTCQAEKRIQNIVKCYSKVATIMIKTLDPKIPSLVLHCCGNCRNIAE